MKKYLDANTHDLVNLHCAMVVWCSKNKQNLIQKAKQKHTTNELKFNNITNMALASLQHYCFKHMGEVHSYMLRLL